MDFTTLQAIQTLTYLDIDQLINIGKTPKTGDILKGSDSYFAQITRVGTSVIEFTVIGQNTDFEELRQDIVDLQNTKANKQQEAWITPTLLNGWKTFDGETFQYRKNQFGKVEFQGRLDPSTKTNNNFMTLPVGYRPQKIMYFNFGGNNYVVFTNTGSCQNFFSIWLSFGGFSFYTD